MIIKSVFDEAFIPYGKVLDNFDSSALVKALEETPCPADSTVYAPGDPNLEALPAARELSLRGFGGMPVQVGYCNGYNKKLNCLEYHRDSEINVPAQDVVLLVAPQQKIRDGVIDTSEVEAFLAPAGCAVEFYATTLHYAPCCPKGFDSFRVAVVLPKGTNTDIEPDFEAKGKEDKLLWAKNKWLIAHPETDEAAQGAFAGLTGENIVLE